jgi:hypothetical protein
MENNNLESISDDILKTIANSILNTKPVDFVTCVNEYAHGTRYVTYDTEVCKLKNDKVVNILDPEYFGIYSARVYININDFKKIYIRNIIKNWNCSDNEDKEYILKTFAR